MTKGDKQMTKVEYKWKRVSRNEECGKGVEGMGQRRWGGTYLGKGAEECGVEWGCGRVAENCGGVAEGCGMEWECGQVVEEWKTECPLTIALCTLLDDPAKKKVTVVVSPLKQLQKSQANEFTIHFGIHAVTINEDTPQDSTWWSISKMFLPYSSVRPEGW